MNYEVPSYFDESKADKIYCIDYQGIKDAAVAYAKAANIKPSVTDQQKIALLSIDTQITFCNPKSELYVGGRSGRGAIDDSIRIAKWIYRVMPTTLAFSFDTHRVFQIFHQVYWVDANGNHPAPNTNITDEDVRNGVWRVNPAMVGITGKSYSYLQQHAQHYVSSLKRQGKYALIIWPFHAMFGGVGYALVPIIEEAAHFHSIARKSQRLDLIKGGSVFSENYGIFAVEVDDDHTGTKIVADPIDPVRIVSTHDKTYINGQAKEFCVLSTIRQMLEKISAVDRSLLSRIYILTDAMSSVVVRDANGDIIPGLDFTDVSTKEFADMKTRYGVNFVSTTDPV